MSAKRLRTTRGVDPLAPRDRYGDVRRHAPPEKKQRAYDARVVSKPRGAHGSRFAPVRREVRDLLAAARAESGEAQAMRYERAAGVRLPRPDYTWTYRSVYDDTVLRGTTRTVRTTRERVEATLASRARRVGERHWLRITAAGRWGTWGYAGFGARADTPAYRDRLARFLRAVTEGRSYAVLTVLRNVVRLLDAPAGTIEIGPTNRWSGAVRWDPAWLHAYLAESPPLERCIRMRREFLEELHADATLATRVSRKGTNRRAR